ncbi:MAG TPA: hypothetical protein VJG90_06550 [Candidatus Nanoarchaeia archaeon]|nr:hypothetical protein [Candidatus Nanoarchaeia archaeon]
MGLLNRLFSSPESTGKKIEVNDLAIQKIWRDYLETTSTKKAIIEQLGSGEDLSNLLHLLKRLLSSELVDLSNEEKREEELLADLERIEHTKRIKRVQRLKQCLGYAETRHEYVYRLLEQLHSGLKIQMHLVESLLANPQHPDKLITHLKQQFELETKIIQKINQIETFQSLFAALVKGEHIILKMDLKEERLLRLMEERLRKIFSQEITEGITYRWAITVFNKVQDIVMDHAAIL